jgi:hypothetical protein
MAKIHKKKKQNKRQKKKKRQQNGKKTEEKTTQRPKDRRTDNTMAKREKNRQHNGQQTEEQTTQWPKERVLKDNDLQNIDIKLTNDITHKVKPYLAIPLNMINVWFVDVSRGK